MTDDEKFEYKSEEKPIKYVVNILGANMTNGLECVWKCEVLSGGRDDILYFTWEFNWDELKKKGIDGFTGYITVRPSLNYASFNMNKIAVNLNESNHVIKKDIVAIESNYDRCYAIFEFSLTPHYIQHEEVEEESVFMFTPSEQNDAVLVVDGKKIPVNKAFLSCFSEFFRALFSSNYKEGQMNEIPIEEIAFNDFKLLLGTISPTPIFPTDQTVEKLLELADRFMMPFVIAHCEYYLLHVSKLGNEKKMLMGEKYGMKKILAKSILEIDTIEKAKKWKQSPEYAQFSSDTKAKVFEKFF